MIKNGLEYKECPGCKRICLKPEMTSGGICKDCLIKSLEKKKKRLEEELKTAEQRILDNWCRNEDDPCPFLSELEKENRRLEEENKHLRSIVDRAKDEKLIDF